VPVQQWEPPRRIATTPAHEGPVWFSDENALYLTTVPRSRRSDAPVVDVVRLRLDDSLRLVGCDVVAEDANAANGMCASVDGGLLVCEQGSRRSRARISRLDRRTGRRETVCDSADGAPLTSPNDVVQSADGTIWFTDPGYGHLQGFREAPVLPDGVRRIDPTGVATTVTTRFDKPNGIALSPDGRRLYVGDSGANHEPGSYDARRPHDVWAFDVWPDGEIAWPVWLATIAPGYPDGLKTDADGLIYVSCATGVQVLDRYGALLDHIPVAGAVNFCFGGPTGDTLLVTDDCGVRSVQPIRERTFA